MLYFAEPVAAPLSSPPSLPPGCTLHQCNPGLPCRNISLKSLRLTLEDDMQLEAGTLKPHKELLSALIDRVRGKGSMFCSPPPACIAAGSVG